MFHGYVKKDGSIVFTLGRSIISKGKVLARPDDILVLTGTMVTNLTQHISFSVGDNQLHQIMTRLAA